MRRFLLLLPFLVALGSVLYFLSRLQGFCFSDFFHRALDF